MVIHTTPLLLLALTTLLWSSLADMSQEDKAALRLKVKEMFLHAYKNYKNYAFPADELMPLSCKGRVRGLQKSRGDVDDVLGNFSLTMIDALDSLFLLNELDEFEWGVKSVIEEVSFDSDIEVSVFETNIRIIGGLLGAHVSALELQRANRSRMIWYSDELLQMAVDVANRLLPAFNTSTGIPLPRINLRYGCDRLNRKEQHTCTACGGTMILEFATLSRLTGNPIYEDKAARALAALWKQRSRQSNLMGRVINVHNGDWIRRDSGIGAGIDSYYEYLLKAFMLLGEPVYLHRFNTHYEAIKRYLSGPKSAAFPFLFLDVHMHRPSERARNYMDSLFAFWPGLQVLSGDVESAVALHEYLFQVHKRNKLIPEAFTADLRVHWGEHLLRPEFVESTYLLHQATKDPYYLDVGAQLVADLQTYTRVPCGFAAIEDVRTMKHVDRLDSFVLAETFKYLYMLFSEPSDLPISLGDFVLTTEAHLLPLDLSRLHPSRRSSDVTDRSKSETNCTTPVARRISSTDETSSVNHHGDRDPGVESVLRRFGRCPTISQAQLSYPGCSPLHAHRDDHVRPNNNAPSCSVHDGPGWYRSKLLLRDWIRSRHMKHNVPNPSHCTSTRLSWRHIDLIRQPLRQLAIHFDRQESQQANAQTDSISHSSLSSAFVPLRAADFKPNNPNHLAILKRMGIELSMNKDSRLIVRHEQNSAENAQFAVAGLLFIHELLSRFKEQAEATPPVQQHYVVLLSPPSFGRIHLPACPSQFGVFPGETSHSDPSSWQPLISSVRIAFPLDGCGDISVQSAAYPAESLDWNSSSEGSQVLADSTDIFMSESYGPLAGSIGVVRRGGCLFIEKARNLAKAGAIGGIVLDNSENSSAANSAMFSMSGEEDSTNNHVDLPFVLLFGAERDTLLQAMRESWLRVRKPLTVSLTKEYFPDMTFSSSLKLFFEDRAFTPDLLHLNHAFNTPIVDYYLLSELHLATTALTSMAYRLPSFTTGGFGISRLPGPYTGCVECNSSENNFLLTYQWLLTLYVHREELDDYISFADDTSLFHPDNIPKWIDAFSYSFEKSGVDMNCRGLLLALADMTLHNATHPYTTTGTTRFVRLLASWTLYTNRCLNRLYEFARFSSTFGIHRVVPNDEVATLSHLSLVITFAPAATEGVPGPSGLSS